MRSVNLKSRAVALVAAGVVAGGVGGVAIAQLGTATAASPKPAPRSSMQPMHPGMHPGLRPGVGMLGGLFAAGRILHGEATVQTPKGLQDVVVQTGTIASTTDSTITVKSSDGVTNTYTVDKTTRIVLNGSSGTLSKLQTGDTVHVLAVKSGASTVAKAVLDGVPPQHRFGGHGRWQPAPPAAGATG